MRRNNILLGTIMVVITLTLVTLMMSYDGTKSQKNNITLLSGHSSQRGARHNSGDNAMVKNLAFDYAQGSMQSRAYANAGNRTFKGINKEGRSYNILGNEPEYRSQRRSGGNIGGGSISLKGGRSSNASTGQHMTAITPVGATYSRLSLNHMKEDPFVQIGDVAAGPDDYGGGTNPGSPDDPWQKPPLGSPLIPLMIFAGAWVAIKKFKK